MWYSCQNNHNKSQQFLNPKDQTCEYQTYYWLTSTDPNIIHKIDQMSYFLIRF